ncbi:MAG TPA: hypothetical protein VN408_32850 [Actinoplanes sp.]|nr:hypothetical protein [Actinoplanes sp.]
MTESDHLVAVYLARVDQAAMRLPAGRREELVNDLREHIEIARAELEEETEASIRTILDRLGDPESIVAAADTQTDLPRVMPAAPAYAPPAPVKSSNRNLWITLGVLAVIGVVVLFCAAFSLDRGSSYDPAPIRPEVTAVPAEPASEPSGN